MKIHNVIYLSIIMSDIISYKKKYLDEKEKNNNIVSEMMEQLSNFNNENQATVSAALIKNMSSGLLNFRV